MPAAKINVSRAVPAFLQCEKHFPDFVEKRQGIRAWADKIGVSTKIASEFLNKKVVDINRRAVDSFLKLSAPHADAINATATRQLERLATLALIPEEAWGPEHYRLERHALSVLKSVSQWLPMANGVIPSPTESNNGDPDGAGDAIDDDGEPGELQDGL